MHICGMDFSSWASYWQIKALLMPAPSVVTRQNQYFPDNAERMSVHCLASGCIGKYTPSALEISLGRGFCTPRPLGNLLGLGGCIFQYIPPLGSVRIQYPLILVEHGYIMHANSVYTICAILAIHMHVEASLVEFISFLYLYQPVRDRAE